MTDTMIPPRKSPTLNHQVVYKLMSPAWLSSAGQFHVSACSQQALCQYAKYADKLSAVLSEGARVHSKSSGRVLDSW